MLLKENLPNWWALEIDVHILNELTVCQNVHLICVD